MKLTTLQKALFLRVLAVCDNAWSRARSSGERVTFASLYYKGLFERQARRGKEGDADAAYEYRVPAFVRAEITRINSVTEAEETFSSIFENYLHSREDHISRAARPSQKDRP